MALEWIREKASASWEESDKPTKRASVELLAKVSDKTDGRAVITASDDCPAVGAQMAGEDPGMLCRSVKLELQDLTADGGALWSRAAEYSTESENASGGSDGSTDPDPTARPAELRLSFERTEYPWYQAKANPTAEDDDGAAVDIAASAAAWFRRKAVIASDGTPFDPNPTTTVVDGVYTFSKNIETTDAAALFRILKRHTNAINSNPFVIAYRGSQIQFAAGTMHLFDASSEPGYENGVQYERVSLVFKERNDGWLRKFLDQGIGYDIQDFDPRKPPPIPVDANGEQVPGAIRLLNGKGKKLVDGKPVFLKFQEFTELDFRQLRIAEIQ